MVNEKALKGLTEEQKQEYKDLVKEYNEAAQANSIHARNVGKSEKKRYHEATKRLSEFTTKHNLQK